MHQQGELCKEPRCRSRVGSGTKDEQERAWKEDGRDEGHDVRRAYFYATARRKVSVRPLAVDAASAMSGGLHRAMHGTRGAFVKLGA